MVAAAWVAGWAAVFAAAPGFASATALAVALIVVTGVGAGLALGRWWAAALPFAVVPVFASPAAYTPSGEPDYGLGFVVACAFLLMSVPSLIAGVWIRRRRGRG